MRYKIYVQTKMQQNQSHLVCVAAFENIRDRNACMPEFRELYQGQNVLAVDEVE